MVEEGGRSTRQPWVKEGQRKRKRLEGEGSGEKKTIRLALFLKGREEGSKRVAEERLKKCSLEEGGGALHHW